MIISYIDPRTIAFTLYYLYIMVCVASLVTLLIYLPFYLKRTDEEDKKRKKIRFNYLENLFWQIEFAKKSKYYRGNIAGLLAKGFAFKSGYPLATYGQISELIKEDKIDIPNEVKDFIIEAAEFYSSFSDSDIYDSFLSKLLKSLTKKKNYIDQEKQLERAIELLFKKFNG
ncbi:MAG: hypothetical protein GYA61_00270 [Spirochaetales bacterium]|nr:hypothetical protein [Exilispira sp.]NMC66639.1 hypothetical protein [Spirochaetales bacterium]